MKVIAYLYSDPLFEAPPDPSVWGWEIDLIYQDFGGRQQLFQLLNDCQLKPINYLLIRRLEELGDSVAEVSDRLSQLEALGITLLAVEQNYTSSPTPTSEMGAVRADLIKLLREVQRNQRSRRIRQGHARNRVKALPPPGKAPYGYRRGKDRYTVDRSTAPVIKDFFDHFLLYGSLRGAVRYLEKKYGKKISVSTGHRWLTSPVYRGDLAHDNEQTIPDTHIAIVSRDEAAQVDRLLRRNRYLPPRTASAPRSLAGLVTCTECQSAMTVSRVTVARKPQEYLYLRPTNCPKRPKCKSIPYGQVLEQTIQSICRELPRAVAGVEMPNIEQVKQAIATQITNRQEILTQLPDLIASGILDTETAELRAYKLRTEIATLQQQIAQLPPVNLKAIAQTVSIPQFWLDLSESERRFYFREFIQQIQLTRQHESWQLQLVFIF